MNKQEQKVLKQRMNNEFKKFKEFIENLPFGENISNRRGCYIHLSFAKLSVNKTYLVNTEKTIKVGGVRKEKKTKYSIFSQEKKKRVYISYTQNLCRTSYETRDPLKDKWGGALLIPSTKKELRIISCSGLPETLDECFCAWLLHEVFGVNAWNIASIFRKRAISYEIEQVLDYLYQKEQTA